MGADRVHEHQPQAEPVSAGAARPGEPAELTHPVEAAAWAEPFDLPGLLDLAARLGVRVAVAESLTGGLLADAFVSVPGASRVFSGGVVAYDTGLKHSLLGVDASLLAARGPVDSEVARQMASGVRAACAVPIDTADVAMPASIGLSTTGVAGPDPDPATGQAAGTVWVGVSSTLGGRAVRVHTAGSRRDIRIAAVHAALAECAAELQKLGALITENSPVTTRKIDGIKQT